MSDDLKDLIQSLHDKIDGKKEGISLVGTGNNALFHPIGVIALVVQAVVFGMWIQSMKSDIDYLKKDHLSDISRIEEVHSDDHQSLLEEHTKLRAENDVLQTRTNEQQQDLEDLWEDIRRSSSR